MATKTGKHKLLVLTSGGDAPGMNAAVRAVVRSACYYDIEVFGCRRGYQGLVDQDIFPMDVASVANCIQRGGTILETSRCKTFLEKSTRDKCRAFLAERGIDFFVPIGGDGTFRGASLLEHEGGPKSVGVPGSIDNDIIGSDYTIGYDTARNTALEAIDKIRDTASSHGRYFLVETMGHNTGFLAVDVAIAGGAEYVITPEFPMNSQELAEKLNAPRRKKQSMIIVVAESKQPGRSIFLAEGLRKLTTFEYRVCILGHTQRGGSPTAMDRLAGSFMGNLAVETLLSGKSDCMTVLNGTKYETAAYPDPNKPGRRLTDEHMIKINNILAT
ncbi:MAG: 6-phosphofructokinase [Gammaproteobacteria bacterium]